jgi:hypothetical protein
MRNILGRFERQHENLLSNRQFAARMVRFAFLGIAIEGAVILIGSMGFHYIGGLNWLDGALNATMVITGNGPAFEPQTEGAKIFQIIFSLSGVIGFVLILSVMLAPVFHRVLHHFHIAPDDSAPKTMKG